MAATFYLLDKTETKRDEDILMVSMNDKVRINARFLKYNPCFFFTDIAVASFLSAFVPNPSDEHCQFRREREQQVKHWVG